MDRWSNSVWQRCLRFKQARTFGIVRDHHRSQEFIEFLSIADAHYPSDWKLRIVLDNHSSHVSKATMGWLKKRPNRFEFIFTPTRLFEILKSEKISPIKSVIYEANTVRTQKYPSIAASYVVFSKKMIPAPQVCFCAITQFVIISNRCHIKMPSWLEYGILTKYSVTTISALQVKFVNKHIHSMFVVLGGITGFSPWQAGWIYSLSLKLATIVSRVCYIQRRIRENTNIGRSQI